MTKAPLERIASSVTENRGFVYLVHKTAYWVLSVMTTIGIYSANHCKMNNGCEPRVDWQTGLLPVLLKMDSLQNL